jgi:hypothetical protein
MLHRWRATQPGSTLQSLRQAACNSSKVHLDLTDFIDPSKKACRTLPAKLTLSVLAVYLLVSSCIYAVGFQGYGSRQFKTFRIDVVSAFKGADFNIPTYIRVKFALIRRGCEVFATRNVSEVYLTAGQHAFTGWVKLQHPESFDGIVVANVTESFTSGTLIRVSASLNHSEEDVEPIAWKSIRKTASGVRILEAEDSASFFASPNVSIDYTPPWPLILEAVAPGMVLGICHVAMILCGTFGRPFACKNILASSCIFAALLFAASAAGHCQRPAGARDGFLPAVRAAILTTFAAAVLVSGHLLGHVTLALALIDLAARIVQDAVLYPDTSRIIDEPPWATLAVLAFASIFIAVRRRLWQRAVDAVGGDMQLYDRAWDDWKSDPAHESVRQLAALAARECPASTMRQGQFRPQTGPRPGQLSPTAPKPIARAQNRVGFSRARSERSFLWWSQGDRKAGGDGNNGGSSSGPGACLDEGWEPVQNMDQLYAQVRQSLARAGARGT